MCSGEYSALTQLDSSELYSLLKLNYNPCKRYAILKAYEDVAKEGGIDHRDAIKIHAFFLSKNLQENMQYYRCVFDQLEDIELNALLLNACIKKRDQRDYQPVKAFCEKINLFHDDQHAPLNLINYFLRTGELSPIINSKVEKILKVLGICNAYGLTNLTTKLLNLIPSMAKPIKCFLIGYLINDEQLINHGLENISTNLPSIKIEGNDGNIFLSLNFDSIRDLEIKQKKMIDALVSVIKKYKIPVSIKIGLGFTRCQFDALFYFIKDLGQQIKYLEVFLDSLQKENMGYFNFIVILAERLTHLHIKSSKNYNDKFVFNQLIMGVPPSIEYFGIDSVCHLSRKDLHDLLQTFGKNLKHFYYKAAGDFSEELFHAFVNLCPNLEVFYLDFVKGEVDLSYETLFSFFDGCKKLKTIRLYHSIHSPPFEGDRYDLGSLNLLQAAFPERQIIINYKNPFVTQKILNSFSENEKAKRV